MFLVIIKFIPGKKNLVSVFSFRPFKQRPTNSSQPLCLGRKTRRSQCVKFESVVLEQESQGPPAAVGERRGGAASIIWIVELLQNLFLLDAM